MDLMKLLPGDMSKTLKEFESFLTQAGENLHALVEKMEHHNDVLIDVQSRSKTLEAQLARVEMWISKQTM